MTPSKRSTAGFTLLELMAVVAVVGIMIAIAAPGFGDARRRERASSYATSMATTFNAIRGAAAHSGRAHAIQFRGNGTVSTWRGAHRHCNAAQFDQIIGASCAGSDRCLEFLSPTHMLPAGANWTYEVTTTAPDTDFVMCVEPNGRTAYAASPSVRFTYDAAGAMSGGVMITVQLRDSGSDVGPERRVVWPMGAPARRDR